MYITYSEVRVARGTKTGKRHWPALVILFVTGLVLTLILHGWGINTAAASAHSRTYSVRPGDTVWSIAVAQQHGDPRVISEQIEAVNHLGAWSTIYPGQVLEIPQ